MCISASPNRDALFLCPDFIGGISIRKRNNRVVVHLNDTELSKLEQDTATAGIILDKRLRVFCIREADNIAVIGFVKADNARKPSHFRNLDQGVVIILTVVYV